MFYIGEFSKMGRTTVKTLHHYDHIGLLRPEAVDAVTGYRLYTTRQLYQLHRIQALRQAGLSIDEVSAILNGADLAPILARCRSRIENDLKKRQDELARIAFIELNEGKDPHMKYQATIKDIPPCIVYTKRVTVPNFDAYNEVIPAIGRAVMAANPTLKCAKPDYCFISYLDGEYKPTDFTIEYNEAVEEFGVETDGIIFRELPGAHVVSVMHQGAYDDLGQAYAFLMEWMQQNGYRASDLARECYIDGIWNKQDPVDYLTEIQIPITPINPA